MIPIKLVRQKKQQEDSLYEYTCNKSLSNDFIPKINQLHLNLTLILHYELLENSPVL